MTSIPFPSRTEASWTPCPSCGKPLPVDLDLIDLYFAGRDALCPACGGKVEPWSFFLGMIQGNFFHYHALMALGSSDHRPGV